MNIARWLHDESSALDLTRFRKAWQRCGHAPRRMTGLGAGIAASNDWFPNTSVILGPIALRIRIVLGLVVVLVHLCVGSVLNVITVVIIRERDRQLAVNGTDLLRR